MSPIHTDFSLRFAHDSRNHVRLGKCLNKGLIDERHSCVQCKDSRSCRVSVPPLAQQTHVECEDVTYRERTSIDASLKARLDALWMVGSAARALSFALTSRSPACEVEMVLPPPFL